MLITFLILNKEVLDSSPRVFKMIISENHGLESKIRELKKIKLKILQSNTKPDKN